jgi:hypothetical protein
MDIQRLGRAFLSLVRFLGRGKMPVRGAQQRITDAVLMWQGVSKHRHRFGGVEYRLGKRELGHIHGDYLVDIPFPTRLAREIVAEGRAEPHHILPNSGWVSFYIHEPEDVEKAIALLKMSLDVALKQKTRTRKIEVGD